MHFKKNISNGSIFLAIVGGIISTTAAIFCIVFPNTKIGRGIVTLIAVITLLVASSAISSSQYKYYSKSNLWSFILGIISLCLGFLNLYYAYNMRHTYDSILQYKWYVNKEKRLRKNRVNKEIEN
jgi:uncharacterized membrane protein HdeD (DUF308 family)